MTKCNDHSVWPLAIWVIQVSDQSGRCPATKNAMEKNKSSNLPRFSQCCPDLILYLRIFKLNLTVAWYISVSFSSLLVDVIYEGTHANLQMMCLYLYLSLFRTLSRRTTMHSDILLVLLKKNCNIPNVTTNATYLAVLPRQGPRLTLGSQTGERTPKKAIFQLRRPVV